MFRIFIAACGFLACFCLTVVADDDLYSPYYPTSLKDIFIVNSEYSSAADLYLVINVGEADMVGPNGLSHYLEHLALFSSTYQQRQAHNIADNENAFAYPLSTLFYGRAESAKDFEKILSQFKAVFAPITLDEKFMLEERKIVEREYEKILQEQPLLPDQAQMLKNLFGPNQLGRSVIGSPNSIRSLSTANALAVHQQYYKPQNAVLYVIGDIKFGSFSSSIKKYFPEEDAGVEVPVRAPIKLGNRRILDEVERPSLYRDRVLIKKFFAFPEKYDWAQKLVLRDHLHEILSSSLPSGLRKPLQFDDFWAADLVISNEFATENIIEMSIEAAPDLGVKIEDLHREIERQLRLIAENGVSRQSFYDLKNDTEFFYADLQNSPRDLDEYVLTSLINGVHPVNGKQIEKAAKNLDHLDFDLLMQAVVAPTDTAVRYLRTKN